MERGWLWNGWWMKRAGQHWCHRYLWWSTHDLVWLEAIYLLPVRSMSGNKMAQLLIAPSHPKLFQRRKTYFLTVGGLLASAFPWLQPLQLVPVGVGHSFKGQACVHWWLQDSRGRYQCGDTEQIHLHSSSNHQEVVQEVSACKWWYFWTLFDNHVDLE